ncbi:ribonuclease H-like domain-containing protein [Tanacetum coccineum]
MTYVSFLNLIKKNLHYLDAGFSLVRKTEKKLGPEGSPVTDPTLYHSLTGALQHLTFTRPDLSYAVQQLCLYMHDPREPHLNAMKHVLRYLRGTIDFGLQLFRSTTSWLIAYSDVGLLLDTIAEAEYRGVGNAVAETSWIRNLFRELYTPLFTAEDLSTVIGHLADAAVIGRLDWGFVTSWREEDLIERIRPSTCQYLPCRLLYSFEDSCAARDDLRKAYKKCNDISQESRALICTLLKESSDKDRKLHLSMYGKAAQLEKQMGAKLAWLREKYSRHTHENIVSPKGAHVKVGTQAVVSQLIGQQLLPGKLLEVFCISISVEERLLVAKERKFFDAEDVRNAVRESCNSDIRSSLSSVSARRVSISTSMSSILAVTSYGLSSDVSDAGLPSEKVVVSGKNGDDGDLLLFRDSPGWRGQSFGMECPLVGLPVLGSCQARCWKVIETFLEYTLHTTE